MVEWGRVGKEEGAVRQPETERERETVTWAEEKNKAEEATGIDGITADTHSL